jgi:hypothetical protein
VPVREHVEDRSVDVAGLRAQDQLAVDEVAWALAITRRAGGATTPCPSGGTRSVADAGCPCHGVALALTCPRLPTPEPA